MPPPGIPKPSRKGKGKRTSSSGDAGSAFKDSNKFLNVSQRLHELIKDHNQKHRDDKEMLYEEFPDDGQTHSERNRDALKLVGNLLADRLSHKNSNGQTMSYYGVNTAAEVPSALMREVEEELNKECELRIYRQAKHSWAIKSFIEQKMASKSRKYRAVLKEKKKQMNEENKLAGAERVNNKDEICMNASSRVVSNPGGNQQFSRRTASNLEGEFEGEDTHVHGKMADDEARSHLAAKGAKQAFEKANLVADTYRPEVTGRDNDYHVASTGTEGLNEMGDYRNEYEGGEAEYDAFEDEVTPYLQRTAKERAVPNQNDGITIQIHPQPNSTCRDAEAEEIIALRAKLVELENAQKESIEELSQQPVALRANRIPTGRSRLMDIPKTTARSSKRREVSGRNISQTRSVRGRFR